MPDWLNRICLGLYVFLPLAFSGLWKRALIFSVSLLVGFAGPLLAMPELPTLHSDKGWFWDAFASEAYKHNQYKDVILAVIPVVFVCFTDFMNHVLDENFRYLDSRLIYNGTFTILAFLLIAAAVLPFSFASLAADKPIWIADFRYSWPFAKLVVYGAFIFEFALGWVEALRHARQVLGLSGPTYKRQGSKRLMTS